MERLGIEQANASQRLAVLRAKNILPSRKAGNQVFYSVRDPLIIEVLDVMRRYSHAHMREVLATVTFTLTVLADLTVAVEIGIVLAALLYIYRISQTTTLAPVRRLCSAPARS
jgi:hypothetical protein